MTLRIAILFLLLEVIGLFVSFGLLIPMQPPDNFQQLINMVPIISSDIVKATSIPSLIYAVAMVLLSFRHEQITETSRPLFLAAGLAAIFAILGILMYAYFTGELGELIADVRHEPSVIFFLGACAVVVAVVAGTIATEMAKKCFLAVDRFEKREY